MNDKLYYNANLFNFTDRAIQAKYNEVKTVPILDKRSDYYLSVIRFSCPATSIPIFFFKPQKYFVTLSVGNGNYTTVELQYKTYLKDPSAAPDNTINIFNKARIFFYQQFLDSINEALNTAINNISGPAGTTLPIRFFYDRDADTFDFIFPKIYVSNDIRFYMSNLLYTKFLAYAAYVMSPVTVTNADYQILLYSDVNNNFNTDYYINKQASSVYYWFEWNKIVIKSFNMNISGESISSTENGNPITELILTDYEVSNSTTRDALISVLYNPTAEYRLASFETSDPLRIIDYQVFVQYKSGFLYPLELLPGESINMKILFTKKPYRL